MADSKLYVVATPLGNRGDITDRAKETLKACRVIFAEDTRELRKLLEMLQISAQTKTFHSYAAHNLREANVAALSALSEGHDVALVTDRGTPGISDPGAEMVKLAREEGYAVVPVPGVSAVACLWSVAGLSEKEFSFVGFFPEENREKKRWYERVTQWNGPVLFYESPHRIHSTLEELKEKFPDGRVFVGREMTKAFEEFYWVELRELDASAIQARGEFAAILIPQAPAPQKIPVETYIELRGLADKDWSKKVAELTGQSAKEIYNALQEKKRNSGL